jgi:hypothetical protein
MAQVGYDFTKNWGVFAFAGIDDPKDRDVLAAVATGPKLKNQMYVGLLRWRTGQYALGLEWLHDDLHSGAANVKTTGNQVSLSALYTF